jgi:hypothetical protein
LSRFVDTGVRELLEQGCDVSIERLKEQHIKVHATPAPHAGLMQQEISFELTKKSLAGD